MMKKLNKVFILFVLIECFVAMGSPIKTPVKGSVQYSILKDVSKCFSFLIEHDTVPQKTTISIKPKNFTIKKGQAYFIHSSIDMPYWIVSAKNNGELKLCIPPVWRAAFAVSPVRGSNMLKNSSFEQSNGKSAAQWKTICTSEVMPKHSYKIKSSTIINSTPIIDKKDTVSQSGKYHQDGLFCLKMDKKSYKGTISCQAPAIAVKAGQSYYVSGFYYPAKFSVGTTYCIKVKLLHNNRTKKIITDRYWLSFPPYWTRKGEWRYTFNKIDIPKSWKGNIQAQVNIEMDGHPGIVYWDNLDFRISPVLARVPGKVVKRTPVMTKEQLDKLYRNKTPYSAKVVRYNGKPIIEVNGTKGPVLPFGSRNSSLIKVAKDAGIDTVILQVHLNRWLIKKKSIWQGQGKYNWKILDDALYNILSYAPNSKIILFVSGGAYTEFAKDHPDSAWVSSDGKRNHRFFNAPPVPAYSLISSEVRREIGKTYRLLGEYIAKSSLGKSIIGIHIGMASDAQWYSPVKPWSYKNFDYSEGSRQSVIKEIRKLYKNDVLKLQKAWNTPKITFENITMPTIAELSAEKCFLDKQKGADKRIIDLTLAYHKAIVKTMNILAEEFKKGIKRPAIALTYFPANCVMAKSELLNSANIDGFVSCSGYMRNRNLGSHNGTRHAFGSIKLHNKLYLAEVDYRSEYSAYRDCFYRRWLGMARGIDGHFNRLRRMFGYLYSQGVWGWFMTIGQQGHNTWHGAFAPVLKEIKRAADMTICKNPDETGQIAIFKDEYFQAYYSYRNRIDHFMEHAASIDRVMSRSGFQYQTYLLNDLTNSKREKAKINIFTTATSLSNKQIKWIEDNLQKDGNILVFTGDAGRIAKGGFKKNIKRLTGMNIKSRPDIIVPYNLSLNKFIDPLAPGVPNTTLWMSNFRGPLFYVDDNTASALAVISGTALPCVAVKRHKNWTAVYIGTSLERAVTSKFIKSIAEQAGIKPIGPEGDITYYGNGFLVIHATTPGVKKLQWSKNADLIDITTNKTIVKNTKNFSCNMTFGETRWFRLNYLP